MAYHLGSEVATVPGWDRDIELSGPLLGHSVPRLVVAQRTAEVPLVLSAGRLALCKAGNCILNLPAWRASNVFAGVMPCRHT